MPHTLGDDIGQELPGPADKRLALQIFVASRPFADKHQLGVRITNTENDMGPAEQSLQRWQSPMAARSSSKRLGLQCRNMVIRASISNVTARS